MLINKIDREEAVLSFSGFDLDVLMRPLDEYLKNNTNSLPFIEFYNQIKAIRNIVNTGMINPPKGEYNYDN